VIGHSWGAMTVAALPAVGISPRRLVLYDPPALPRTFMAAITSDPVEHRYGDAATAEAAVRAANPGWTEGDIRAKADGLATFDEAAVRDILTGNGDWDAGLADLADPAAAAIDVRVVRGEPGSGSYVAASVLPALARRVGAERILTVADGPHSPHRTHPEATTLALLRALDRT
jgi:pimeloyl-ACP methyl ester carboxylesterase